MIPAAVTTTTFDIYVHIPAGVDVVDAAAADVAGARIGPATATGTGTATAPTGAGTTTTPATPSCRLSHRGHGKARQNEGAHRRQIQLAE
jgi:hypothetical protein